MKQCSKCKLSKEYSSFNKGTNGGYTSYCKDCQKQYYLERTEGKRKRHSDGRIRRCRVCEVDKLLSEFRKQKSSRYRVPYCKDCATHYAHGNLMRNKYGISAKIYAEMLYSQNNVCAICKKSDTKRLSVDHDHSCCDGEKSCGKCIRGLLCSRCNRTLGMIQDNTEYLKSMIKYLENF